MSSYVYLLISIVSVSKLEKGETEACCVGGLRYDFTIP